VLGAVCFLGPVLPASRVWVRALIFALVWFMVWRYLDWRLFTTVWPARGTWYAISWIWICFAVEVLAFADQLILYITFLRTTNRSAEADVHESRIRALTAAQLPSVDVFIPTYNEPMEVLEKSITGALCLDYPNYRVWVLDDGRRPWLKDFCEARGAGYITRGDNAHAKAGNINHALAQTSGQFIAIFDADFVPQRNFLMRTIGFFADQTIGIVQVPHAFYNHDPVQSNLGLRQTLPDEQRFFFESIMPSRDAWDAAFCCGSNSVTRREALESIGGTVPTSSITEDMLLTLTLLRQGYVTRYLCEPLAFGLAPESLNAFFVQRQRWARGAIQIMYLPQGPFGPGLPFLKRLMFLPTHWLSLGFRALLVVVSPIVFLWTGVAPVVNVTSESVLFYLLPMMLALFGGIWVYAPRQHFPFLAQVLATLQSFKILPTVLVTLVKPFGHVFKVTPKGSGARQMAYERGVFWTAACFMALTVGGLFLNTLPEWRIVDQAGFLPMVACWGALNVVVLFLVCMLCLHARVRRAEERFNVDEDIWIFDRAGALLMGRTRDLSLSGVGVIADSARARNPRVGDDVRVFVAEVGFVEATVARQSGEFLGIEFKLARSLERDLLVRKLFTAGMDMTIAAPSARSVTLALLRSVWATRTGLERAAAEAAPQVAPDASPERLPRESLRIEPRPTSRLAELARDRAKAA
jgi:cellulose synthase/poly-beta-1,6-N-acetylglucosamine synthase-like glycosyltransferase